MIEAETVIRIVREVALGDRVSSADTAAEAALRAEIVVDVDAMAARGIVPDVPFEIPDHSGPIVGESDF